MRWVPDVRQEDDFDCGAAALAALLWYWGVSFPVARALANPVQGMGPDTFEAALRAAGLHVLSGSATVADLDHFTKSGRPAAGLTRFNGIGHWVCVAGVARRWVHYHCPVVGRTKLPAAAWEAAWHDEARHGAGFARWAVVPWR